MTSAIERNINNSMPTLIATVIRLALLLGYLNLAPLAFSWSAVLYGIGVRLDEKPELFFKLRGLSIEDFTQKIINAEKAGILEKAKQKSTRVISQRDADRLFFNS